jgi:hypothetical protein
MKATAQSHSAQRSGRSSPVRLQGSRAFRLLVALALLSVWASDANAWLYPEHRDISLLAVQHLDADRQAVFDRLWQDARTGDEQRLCAHGADADQGLKPSCLDWAALAAIAGDHSCSSSEMLATVRAADWILPVAAIAAQLKVDLAQIPIVPPEEAVSGSDRAAREQRTQYAIARAQRSTILRASDVRLQAIDAALATRASNNAAHFPLARPDPSVGAYDYAQLTLRIGSDVSAIGAYFWFHLSALQKAGRLANEQLSDDERRMLARAALFDEAFALHFLEDMFAAGHVAGTWGDLSQRKGTHDYYNQNGLEVFTWRSRGQSIVLMGDAHMRPQDAELAAQTVRTSLEQVLDVATRRARDYELPQTPTAPAATDGFDVCKATVLPARDASVTYQAGYRPAIEEVLLGTPIPGLGAGFGAVPRFRSEIGTFFGFAGSIDVRQIDGGFLPTQTQHGGMAGLDVSFRFGVGLEGAVGDESDGLVFASLGLRTDSNSTNKSASTGLGSLDGSLSAAIPPRSAISLRIRMPFYVFPGDLLLASPLYLINKDAYTRLGVTATNGGLIPWQLGHATRHGRYQFVIGRELGVTFHGRHTVDQIWVPTDGALGQVVNYESVTYDLPIFEYRPYRSFSSNQSSSVMLQLFIGGDFPHKASVAYPLGTPAPDLEPIYSVGVRVVFDWRHYR